MLKKSPELDSLIKLLRKRASDLAFERQDGGVQAMEQMPEYQEMNDEAKALVKKHLKEDSKSGVYEAIAGAIKEVSAV